MASEYIQKIVQQGITTFEYSYKTPKDFLQDQEYLTQKGYLVFPEFEGEHIHILAVRSEEGDLVHCLTEPIDADAVLKDLENLKVFKTSKR